jgi:peptide/nickel transport system substrate-binding protein
MPREFSRRGVLKGIASTAALAGTGVLLDACSGSSSSTPTSSSYTLSHPQWGGDLRIGINQAQPAENLNPYMEIDNADYARDFQLYDLLVYPNATTFDLEYKLAEEITPNSTGDVWVVRLKSDVEFHNGKTLGAEDLIFSVQQMLKPGTAQATVSFIDPNGMSALDSRTVRFVLKEPYGPFPQAFAASNEFIVPVGFDPRHPVGTGPFKLESFTPGQQSVMTRFDNYWGGPAYVDSVTIIDIPDDTARTNALVSGAVHAVNSIPLNALDSLTSNTDLKLLNSRCGDWNPITMRVDVKPFSDVRVRQAMRLIAPRQQMVDIALDGQGRVANDLYTPFDPDYASHLPQRQQDIPQAKSLLRQAGYNDLTVVLNTSDIGEGVLGGTEVFARAAAAAGVTVRLNQIATTEYFGPQYLRYPFAVDTWETYPSYLTQCALADGPGGVFNETHFADPTFDSLYRQAIKTLDPNLRRDMIMQMQRIQWDSGGYLIYAFQNQVDAYSKKITGFIPDKNGWPLTTFGFHRVWFV